MTKHPVALAIALAFATSATLSGCDRTANLTEQEHIQRAKDFDDKGNLKGSIVELKNAIQKNPDSPQARLLLGQIYLKVGMGAEAEKELTQAKKLGVNQETINPHLGEALLLMGEYKRVLDEIEPGEQTSKANLARILHLRGDALLKLGQLRDACNLFQQSLDTDPNNPPTYWGLSQCAVAKNDVAKAKEWLDVALKINDKQAKTWIFVGDLEQLNRNSENALSAYSNALKLEPENLEALNNRATINTNLGRMEDARIDIEKIRKIAPKSLAASYLQALFKVRDKKYTEARDALQEALKIAPDYLPALLLAGSIEYSFGNLQTAEAHFNKVVRAAPKNGVARRMLATTQLRLGRPDDASKTLTAFDFDNVENISLLALSGEIALAKKEFSQAADYFEKAAELSPKNPALRTELGMARLAQGDSRAMADLQAAAEMEDSFGEASTIMILYQLKQHQYDAALVTIAALEKKAPQSPLSWNYRGAAYLGKTDYAKARSSFVQALKLDPKFMPAAINLARLDVQDNKPDDARKRFVAILEDDPQNIRAMMAMADLAASQNREKDYVNWLEKAAKANPNAIPPRAGLVRYHLAKKDNSRALSIATETLNANPESPAALNLLGGTQMAAGQVENAQTTFAKLAVKMPDSSDIFLRLALAQIAAKKYSEARASLNKALQISPGHMQSLDTLLRLELAEKKPEAALQIAQRMEKLQPKSPAGYERKADILVSLNRPQEAVKAYSQALDRGAPSTSLIKLLGAMTTTGDQKGAERYLATWIEQHPNDREARSYAAQLYMLGNRNREAISQYEALNRLNPNDASAINNLAILYQREGDPRAAATAEQALKLAPNEAAIMDTLGWILLEQGQLNRGLNILKTAKTQAPKSGSIHFHYAVALARSGNKSEAKKQLEALIRSGIKFPEKEEAKALLKTL